MDTEALADKPGARTVLAELQDGPKDKVELAEALDKSPSTAKDKIGLLRDAGIEVKYSRAEKCYHLEESVTRGASEIATDEVVPELKDGVALSDLAEQLSTTAGELTDVFDRLEQNGYNLDTKENGSETYYFLPAEVDRRFAIDDGDGHYTFALISDTHLGSKAEHLEELNEFYDRCVERGIDRVFHCGDISDGWKVPPGHLNEIKDEAAGWGRLKEYVIENYPQRDGITTYFIEGNHDNKFYNRNNIRFGRLLGDRREDLQYCGNAQATFVLDREHDIDLELIHPSGGKPYTTGYRLQTLYRERNVNERPTIAGVGHLHGSMYAETEGVKGMYAGAWKGTTTYGKRKGHEAKIGGWIIDMDIKDGVVTNFVPQWQGFEERESGNRYELEEL